MILKFSALVKNLDRGYFFLVFFIEFFSKYKNASFNLNLPKTQVHNYHLLDEQRIHQKKGVILFETNTVSNNSFSVFIPLLLSVFLCLFCLSFVNYMWHDILFFEIYGYYSECMRWNFIYSRKNSFIYLILAIWSIFLWFEHINFENREGYHTQKVNNDYKIGFTLFLISEIMFFFSVFWAFFHFSTGSNFDLGYVWPPIGIDTISFLNLPLLNTLILIVSGLFVTWSHNSLRSENYEETWLGLLITIILGVTFLLCQFCEYVISNFNINDSVFGSIFFFGTGFHGIHVFLGTISLIYNFDKLNNGELSSISHYSYLFTIWYWHFVDIIWLLLYLIFYIWGQ
jgi:cytochrome c oxidase subunit 3